MIKFPHPRYGHQSWQFAGQICISPYIEQLVAALRVEHGDWQHQAEGHCPKTPDGCWTLNDYLIPPKGHNQAKLWLRWSINALDGPGLPRLCLLPFFPNIPSGVYASLSLRVFLPDPELEQLEADFAIDTPLEVLAKRAGLIAPQYLAGLEKAQANRLEREKRYQDKLAILRSPIAR